MMGMRAVRPDRSSCGIHLAVLRLGVIAFVLSAATDADLQTIERRLVARGCAARPTASEARAGSGDTLRAALSAEGSWGDIDYANTDVARWAPLDHLVRLKVMARAYACDRLPEETRRALGASVLRAHDYWIARDLKNSEWWNNEIGAPKLLGDAMILIGPELSPKQRAAGVEILKRGYRPRSDNHWQNTGANRVWHAGVSVIRGVMTGDAALAEESLRAIEDTVTVGTGEGIQRDWSFHQHGPQPYVFGYATDYGLDTLKWTATAAGTRYAMKPESARRLTDFMLDGVQWFVRGQVGDYTVQGRVISRKGGDDLTPRLLPQVEDALAIGGYRAAELRAMQARLTAAQKTGMADRVSALSGHRHFWRSDVTTHHRPGWYASIKSSSPRTFQPESGNGENVKALHLADGLNLVMRTGNEYDDIMPVWDWRRLPGITTEQRDYSLKPEKDWGVFGTSDFAGGVSDGTYGATAFRYDRLGVTAYKAWFFFDRFLVALGAGVSAPGANAPVLTSVNQTLFNGSVTYKLAAKASPLRLNLNGSVASERVAWAHHDGVAYIFPDPSNAVSIEAKPQTGEWREINAQYKDPPFTKNVLKLAVDHAARPVNRTYAYVVAPGIEPGDVERFKASNPVRIVRNDTTVQAVSDQPAGVDQVIFHAPGSVTLRPGLTLASSKPAIVMLRRDGGALAVSVASPVASVRSVRLDLSTRLRGRGAAWSDRQDVSTVTRDLPSGEMSGSSVTSRFAVETPAAAVNRVPGEQQHKRSQRERDGA